MSTACPYAWCSDISLNNEDKVHLQDIQQRRIPSHGSRVVPVELWDPEGCVECKVKFDVADVAYPVVSFGKDGSSQVSRSALMNTSVTCTKVTVVLRSFQKVESLCCGSNAGG